MNPKVSFRDLYNNEIDLVIELLVKHYKECIPDFIEKPNFKKFYKKAIIENDDLKLLIMDINDNVEGFIIYLYEKHPVYFRKDVIIREIYISKSFRKLSIASDSVLALQNIYKTENIFVDLLFKDVRAARFWKKNKFLKYQKRYKLNRIIKSDEE